MKAISPVLSLILLIIIVIVVIGFSFGFFGNLISSTSQQAEEQVAEQTEQMETCFFIEAASGDTIYVRNCGSSPLSEFVILTEGNVVPVVNSPTIDPGKVGEVVIDTSSLEEREYEFTVSVGFIENSITFKPSGGAIDNPPSFVSLSPENVLDITTEFYTKMNVTFSCIAQDDNLLDSMEIYINTTEPFELLYSESNINSQNHEITFTKELPEGYYEWYCNATDNKTQTTESDHKFFEVNKAPVIYNLQNTTGSDPGDFLVIWNTDELSSCTFEYGTDTSYGETMNTGEGEIHFVALSKEPETWYYFRINCTNSTDNDVGHYTGKVFSAPEPPELMNIGETDVTSDSATIVWDTNENADSTVIYDTDQNFLGAPSKSDSTYVMHHQIQLTDLTPDTIYYYKVISKDIYGASNTSAVYSFTTSS